MPGRRSSFTWDRASFRWPRGQARMSPARLRQRARHYRLDCRQPPLSGWSLVPGRTGLTASGTASRAAAKGSEAAGSSALRFFMAEWIPPAVSEAAVPARCVQTPAGAGTHTLGHLCNKRRGSANGRIRSQCANFRGAGYLFARVRDSLQVRYTSQDDGGRVPPSSTSLLDADLPDAPLDRPMSRVYYCFVRCTPRQSDGAHVAGQCRRNA
jgi:hypothetical protein